MGISLYIFSCYTIDQIYIINNYKFHLIKCNVIACLDWRTSGKMNYNTELSFGQLLGNFTIVHTNMHSTNGMI